MQEDRLATPVSMPEGIVGASPAFMRCIEQVWRISRFDIPVLVEGETGTGKEVVARYIHSNSQRGHRAFVSVNCAALPRELMESEFFGHRRGAFTHAVSDRKGYVGQAHRGTLFLDEIASLDLPLQAKLLRFLQEGEFYQVGGAEVQTADVRIIAASNESLARAAREGRFRWDLYYRLNVFQLQLPALRDRPGDIGLLVDHFLEKYGAKYGQPSPGLTYQARSRLETYEWPGNVRELQNLCQRLVIQFPGKPVDSADLGTFGAEQSLSEERETEVGAPFQQQKAEVIRRFEVTYLRKLLTKCDGNVSRAARSAGKHRRAFSELLRKHSIDPAEFRPG